MALYSSNRALDETDRSDNTVEVSGFVDDRQTPKIVGKVKKFNLFKFALNNGAGRRIQCLAWETEVTRVAEIIKLNKIVHIEGARAKEITMPKFNIGNVPYELIIEPWTEIHDHGTLDLLDDDIIEPDVISWEELADNEGETVAIDGWIKMCFREMKHKNKESSYGNGCVTDGHKKIEVRLTSTTNLPAELPKGMAIKIIGRVQCESQLYLQVHSGEHVIPTGEPAMDPNLMINITSGLQKRARHE